MKEENILSVRNPDLAKEWHPTKNVVLTPCKITYASHKKVWWRCEKGHEWEALVKQRSKKNGTNCPFCSNKKVCYDNCLATINPELAKEWNQNKNGELTPNTVVSGSHKKVWWICHEGHEWEAKIVSRNRGDGCPYCYGRRASKENCLATLKPELIEEWHYEKNGELTPHNVTYGSDKKVWWKCSKGHEWEARIEKRSRVRSTGCPKCSASFSTSFPEMSLYYYLSNSFSDTLKDFKVPNSQYKLDIYIPSIKLAVEYDGEYYHKNLKKDKSKDQKLYEELPNVRLIRIREPNCPKYTSNNPNVLFYHLKNLYEPQFEIAITKIFNLISEEYQNISIPVINISQNRGLIYNSIDYYEIENSLIITHPNIAKEWNYGKNFGLTPDKIKSGSHKKVWWVCHIGHEWEAVVKSRKSGSGCPYCSGRNATMENCLAVKNPSLIKEWNYEKNEKTPYDYTVASSKKVWWKCENGHEWERPPKERGRGEGCPHCPRKPIMRVNSNNCLALLKPDIAKQWHPKKNGELTPFDFAVCSSKKVWWLCENEHEWEAPVSNRTKGLTKCPTCSGRIITKDNSLGLKIPSLAKE